MDDNDYDYMEAMDSLLIWRNEAVPFLEAHLHSLETEVARLNSLGYPGTVWIPFLEQKIKALKELLA